MYITRFFATAALVVWQSEFNSARLPASPLRAFNAKDGQLLVD
jgi:hypothetical protein